MRQLTMLIALCSLICVGQVQAQTSLGDANATSSLIFPQAFLKEQVRRKDTKTLKSSDTETSKTPEPSCKGGTIDFNTADGSIKGNYFFHKEESPWRYGFELQGKAINGYASLFASQDISSDAGGHLFVIYSPVVVPAESEPPSSTYWWALARIGYRHGEYKLVALESDAKVPIGIRDERLRGLSGFLHGNLLLGEKWLFGCALGFAPLSNYRELPQVEVTTTIAATPNSPMQAVESTSTARDGDYEVFRTVSGHIDVIYVPERCEHTVGVGAFFRYNYQFNGKQKVEPGMGLFYLGDLREKTDSPKAEPKENFFSKITGGITVQYKRGDSETEGYDLKFGLVTSYNF